MSSPPSATWSSSRPTSLRKSWRKIQRYFKSGAGEYGEGDVFLGVRMGQVFALSKAFIDLPPG